MPPCTRRSWALEGYRLYLLAGANLPRPLLQSENKTSFKKTVLDKGGKNIGKKRGGRVLRKENWVRGVAAEEWKMWGVEVEEEEEEGSTWLNPVVLSDYCKRSCSACSCPCNLSQSSSSSSCSSSTPELIPPLMPIKSLEQRSHPSTHAHFNTPSLSHTHTQLKKYGGVEVEIILYTGPGPAGLDLCT